VEKKKETREFVLEMSLHYQAEHRPIVGFDSNDVIFATHVRGELVAHMDDEFSLGAESGLCDWHHDFPPGTKI